MTVCNNNLQETEVNLKNIPNILERTKKSLDDYQAIFNFYQSKLHKDNFNLDKIQYTNDSIIFTNKSELERLYSEYNENLTFWNCWNNVEKLPMGWNRWIRLKYRYMLITDFEKVKEVFKSNFYPEFYETSNTLDLNENLDEDGYLSYLNHYNNSLIKKVLMYENFYNDEIRELVNYLISIQNEIDKNFKLKSIYSKKIEQLQVIIDVVEHNDMIVCYSLYKKLESCLNESKTLRKEIENESK